MAPEDIQHGLLVALGVLGLIGYLYRVELFKLRLWRILLTLLITLLSSVPVSYAVLYCMTAVFESSSQSYLTPLAEQSWFFALVVYLVEIVTLLNLTEGVIKTLYKAERKEDL